ncbi:MAG TPA: YcxB family protein [Tepidisphaeraceae bacterium]|nr:YcxB family protein [Tepidisphaeraceae bacterium]
MPEESAIVTYALQPDDYVALSEFAQGKATRDNRWLARFSVYIGSVAATILSLAVSDAVSARSITVAAIMTAVFVLLYTSWLWPHPALTLRKQRARYYQSPKLLEQRMLQIDGTGVRQHSDSGESFTRWNTIERVVVTAEYLFIFTSSIGGYIIPRRAFATAAEFLSFAAVAQRHWRPEPDASRTGGFPVVQKSSTAAETVGLETPSTDD